MTTEVWTGRRVFWYFFAFFVLITIVLVTFCVIAVRTHTGLVTDHPYEKGIAYNQVVQAEQQQAELGWKGTIALTPEADRKALVNFTLQDAAGQGVSAGKVYAEFSRPTQQGLDFTVPLLVNDCIEVQTPCSPLAGELSGEARLRGVEIPTSEQHPPQPPFSRQLPRKGGAYLSQVQFPASGLWDVRVYATAGDKTFQATKRVVVP